MKIMKIKQRRPSVPSKAAETRTECKELKIKSNLAVGGCWWPKTTVVRRPAVM